MTVEKCRKCVYLANDLIWCSLLGMNVDGGGCEKWKERRER